MSNAEMVIPSLTVKDKVNYPYILANAILNFHSSIIKAEGLQSEQEVKEAALCLYNSIPASWKDGDPALKEDLKKAITEKKVDVRNVWCGKRVGKPKFENQEHIDPYKLYHACINVMDRKGLISRIEKTEMIDGRFVEDANG